VIWWHTLQHLCGTPQIANILSLISFPRSNANITRIQSFCNYLISKGQNWKNVRIHTNTKKKPQLWLYNERILYVTVGAKISQYIIAPMLRKWPRTVHSPPYRCSLCAIASPICMSLWIGLLRKRLCNAVNYKWCLSLLCIWDNHYANSIRRTAGTKVQYVTVQPLVINFIPSAWLTLKQINITDPGDGGWMILHNVGTQLYAGRSFFFKTTSRSLPMWEPLP